MKTRIEKDSLGSKAVPASVYYGSETARALENFPISGLRFHPDFFWAMAVLKKACAHANLSLKRLDTRRAKAIIRVCDEILSGKLQDQFVTDALQSGAGVSAHMNFNEVITNRALELLGKKRGDYEFLHSHDHVNMGQSTNDVIPTAMRLSALKLFKAFCESSKILELSLQKKAREFLKIVKAGRTHMQDAAPITLGQEFSGWARQLEKGRKRAELVAEFLRELGIGGSAVGTGLNTSLEYRRHVIANLRSLTGFSLQSAKNMFEVMQSDADIAALSGALRVYALSLLQVTNDLRLLNSGPKTGFSEINLPARQPGSSIMPGKVNPVMLEVSAQVAYQVIGNDAAIAAATSGGQLELNVMRPVLIHNLLQSLEILKNVTRVLAALCIQGITANPERCREYAETSYGIAAALNPTLGYSKAAECVKESVRTGKTLRQVVLEKGFLNKSQIEKILSPENLTQPKVK
ncbi:MAG: aspartate ammonia-lyase [Candidatus Omnitrophica bacterium]|nr:aspartate ammonia-lyase [Candidatus Omnitrophota bacterium]